LALFVSTNMLKYFIEQNKIPFNYEFIENNKNSFAVKSLFYNFYYQTKNDMNQNYFKQYHNTLNPTDCIENLTGDELLKFVQIDNMTVIFWDNDLYMTSDDINNDTYFIKDLNTNNSNNYCIPSESDIVNKNKYFIKFRETLKFSIISSNLKHSIEIFPIYDNDFWSCIGRFHLPCVRAYYNGDNCYILPSAISAYMSFINMDYKYFTGSKDPIEILTKYRKRGFGTILGTKEITQLKEYIDNSLYWKNVYDLESNNKTDNEIDDKISDSEFYNKVLCHLDVNHKLFKQHTQSIYDRTYVYIDLNVNELDILNRCAINENGYVNPVKTWIINAIVDNLDNKE